MSDCKLYYAGQELGEDFCWGSVAEDAPWPVVEFAGDEVEVGLVVGDLGALEEVLGSRPVVFSLVPRSRGEYGWAKYTSPVIARVNAAWAARAGMAATEAVRVSLVVVVASRRLAGSATGRV